ncbi:MAG: cysteine--tRNA ligase, partial [Firmicutes bacterium]|nr:cysteine--tRNA ligase [Bacillota bacterium]
GDFNRVLGLFPVDEDGRLVLEEPCFGGKAEELLELLIAVRQEARQRKDWATADRIRAGLRELGIVLEDTPDGVRWRAV